MICSGGVTTCQHHTTQARQELWPAASVGTAGNDHDLRHAAVHHVRHTLRNGTRLTPTARRGAPKAGTHIWPATSFGVMLRPAKQRTEGIAKISVSARIGGKRRG